MGERWWCQPPKGECISSPAGRLYGFPTGESPVVKVLYKTGAFYNLKAPTSPAQRYYITTLGGALNLPVRRSRSQAEPLAPRAVRPGGYLNPRPQGVNLREYSFPPHPSQRPITSNVAHSKKALTITVSAFSVNQQLPILPGRFQPSTFGVCELNYRVRHGYGCILTAIATESLRVCSLKTA